MPARQAGLWPCSIYLLAACQQGAQMFNTGGAGFQQEEMPSPHPPSCSCSEDDSQLVCCFFLCAGSLGN